VFCLYVCSVYVLGLLGGQLVPLGSCSPPSVHGQPQRWTGRAGSAGRCLDSLDRRTRAERPVLVAFGAPSAASRTRASTLTRRSSLMPTPARITSGSRRSHSLLSCAASFTAANASHRQVLWPVYLTPRHHQPRNRHCCAASPPALIQSSRRRPPASVQPQLALAPRAGTTTAGGGGRGAAQPGSSGGQQLEPVCESARSSSSPLTPLRCQRA